MSAIAELPVVSRLPEAAQAEIPLLEGIGWQTYEMLLADLGNNKGIRLTYDQGRLQIMSPLPEHERYSAQLGQFVRVLAAHVRLPLVCLGSMTIRREDLQRGLEPDNCFYLANWPRIKGRRQLDFRHDPPPDLALEIDITHSSLDRLGVYAALGVPEVWRFDGQNLFGYQLGTDGKYAEIARSVVFPALLLADVVPFLQQVFEEDEGTLTTAFEAWLRKQTGA